MLAIHRHRLPRADLEDCYSQATLELLVHVKRGGTFSNRAHMTNALEQRVLSRIQDRRRALHGRSPIEAALATALPLGHGETGGIEILDVRADVERLALSRHDLRRVSRLVHQLPRDQRLVLVHQLWGEVDRREFCAIHGWSAEKYRKVAQRARARLRAQLAGE
jgi:DNA-directed RNA polymerase specialized sigma24 family protein